MDGLSSGKTEVVVEQPPKLGELYSACSKMAAEEERTTGRIVGTMVNLLSWLKEPLVLRPGSLGGRFAALRMVLLDASANVVMTDAQGRVTSRRLTDMKAEDRLAILEEACPLVEKMVSSKRRAEQARPVLSIKVVQGGSRLIVGRRTYRLLVSNAGSDCLGMRLSIELPGGNSSRSTRPRDVKGGSEHEVDTGVSRGLGGAESVRVEVDCRDADGRALFWDGSLRLDEAGWQHAPLRRA